MVIAIANPQPKYIVTNSTFSTTYTGTLNFTPSSTVTTSSTSYFTSFTGGRQMVPVKPGRGWNGKNQMRCMSCGKWAKELTLKPTFLPRTPDGTVACKRCGVSDGYIGRHPLA